MKIFSAKQIAADKKLPPLPNLFIGITGFAGHGKDTVAEMIRQNPRFEFMKQYAYADPIKYIVHETFESRQGLKPDNRKDKETIGEFTINYEKLYYALEYVFDKDFTDDHCHKLYNTLLEEIPHKLFAGSRYFGEVFTTSWRELYQIVGSEWGRQEIDMDLWINQAPTTNTIISDVRGQGDHPTNKNTEAMYVRNNGGIVINVVNPNIEQPVCRNHSSEAGIDPEYIDYEIINNGSLEDLRITVAAVMNDYVNNITGEEYVSSRLQ